MKLVAISDIHNQLSKVVLPPGDLLCIAGDLTMMGTVKELVKFNQDLEAIKHLYEYGIIYCPGNHDLSFEQNLNLAKKLIPNATCLHHESININGYNFFGSGYTPWFHDWAFNVKRGPDIKRLWDQIPLDTDVLITHGPPFNILDATTYDEHVGCEDLLETVLKIKPIAHIFGHIHSGAGVKDFNGTTFVNASICNEKYLPINKPIEIEI